MATKLGKRALFVIGMHRSGTSATTGALQCMGIQLGKKLYHGHTEINAKRYFEHHDIADTNDEALLAIGSSWDDLRTHPHNWWKADELCLYARKIQDYIQRDFNSSELWAVKDPRVCRMLPWWLNILNAQRIEPFFLFVVRSPAAVYRSLKKRDGFNQDRAYLLWILHYLEAELWSRNLPRAFLDFDDFLDAPIDELIRIQTELGISFPVNPSECTHCLNKFLEKGLRHHIDGHTDSIDSQIVTLGEELYDRLRLAARSTAVTLNPEELDVYRSRASAIQAKSTGPFLEQLSDLAKKHGKAQVTINRIMRSYSWYVGKPIRLIERLIGRDV